MLVRFFALYGFATVLLKTNIGKKYIIVLSDRKLLENSDEIFLSCKFVI